MSIFLNEYQVTPTVSGQSTGSIISVNASGGTAPYTVSWSGATVNGYITSTQWNLYDLAEGVYKATITDVNSNVGDTLVYLSAYTLPTFSALVTSYSCITNTNKFCEISVYSAGTSTLTNQSAATLNYSLYRDGTLVKSKVVTSADTSSSTTHTFKNLRNGMYSLTIGRQESLIRNFLVTDTECTASSITLSSGTINSSGGEIITAPFSAITSAWTKNYHFAAANYYVGTSPSTYTTGLYNWGHILNAPGHWFFTGDSSTGRLNYPDVNPNSARTTDTTRYWYLGVSGTTNCQEGWNCSPLGINGDPLVAATSYDLTGATISGASHRGTYYYHRYLDKFFVWDSTTGITESDYAWVTYNPTANRGINGDPVASEIVTTNANTFKFSWIGDDSTFVITNGANQVKSLKGEAIGAYANQLTTEVKLGGGYISGDTQRASYISKCSYLDYSHDIHLYPSGSTEQTASVVLAYFRDDNYLYGQSGATHYLTLDFQQCSGATVSFNKGQSARAFQRDAYGTQLIQGNPCGADAPPEVQALCHEAQMVAVEGFINEFPDIVASFGLTDDNIGEFSYEELYVIFSENDTFLNLYNELLLNLLSDAGFEIEDQYITTTYKEFDTIVLRNGPKGVADEFTSPYTCTNALTTQGCIKIRVTRSGNSGQYFKIQMTDTMGPTGTFSNTTKNVGTTNTFNSAYEINFDLNTSSTWSGTSQSAPEWVSGTELQRFLGGTRVGYMANQYNAIVYQGGLTGTAANYTVSLANTQLISNSSAITLTQETIYAPDTDMYKSLLDSVGNNNTNTSKSCDFYPICGKELKIPHIQPKVTGTIQTLVEPVVILEGLNKLGKDLESTKIINLSAYTGNTPIITANTSGATSDLLLNKSYLKLDIYSYHHSQNKFNLKPEYNYLFNTLSEISTPSLVKKGRALSGTTILPLSGLPTASTWQYIVKPSFIVKDKSTKDPIWIDNSTSKEKVQLDNSVDYYMALVDAPSEPKITNTEIKFQSTSSVRLTSKYATVTGVPDFSGSQSGYTYSAITLPFVPSSNIQVMANGLTLKQTDENSNAFVNGDYYINGIRITFASRTIKNGDIVQIIYPSNGDRSYYNQSFTVGTPGTTDTEQIYQDSANYYITLDYEALGAVSLTLNGQILTEGLDYRRVAPNKLQFLTYKVGEVPDFSSADVINMYYLTQYYVLGLASSSNPNVNVEINKKLGIKEELRFIVYDTNGNIVDKQITMFTTEEVGTIVKIFKITVPSAATYYYTVTHKRYYPLLNGKEITTERNSRRITFTIDSTTFYSPYATKKNDGTSFGAY